MTDEHLPAWSLRLMRELDASDDRARMLAASLTLEQLNWQPRPGSWSIGQCLEHLRITNEVYSTAIASSLEGKSGAPVEEIQPGWFSRWFIRKFVGPSPEMRRAPAPKKIVPAARVELSVLERFLEGNRAVRDLIRRAASCDVNRIRFRNPFIPLIRFTAGTGLQVVSSHEQRHLLQAERVQQSAEFPK